MIELLKNKFKTGKELLNNLNWYNKQTYIIK